MQELFSVIERVAPLDISVLILGESGTGKELVARAIHRQSRRKDGPFVALNCAAIPETLVDSELFGHKRGAFTGAVDARAGAFENANGGTLFLDEIGDIPHGVQIRLLRVLQEREVTRLGTDSPKPIDVRVIAATLADLENAVATGDFREDLFYRLNVICLQIPPLRNRIEDIPLLATHLLERQAKRVGLPTPVIARDALDRLAAHHWPGNVRELENALLRALALHQGEQITADLFPQVSARPAPRPSSPGGSEGEDLSWCDGMTVTEARRCLVDSFERDYVTRLLARTENNISEAARQAGIDRSNLRRMMSRVGIKATTQDD
jgi:two-component system response regulator AtoC